MTKSSTKNAKPFSRRDATGHLDPQYAANLRAKSLASAEPGPGTAFLRAAESDDALAEDLGESFVKAITSGEDDLTEAHDQKVPEEEGGPFVETEASTEFARGVDKSNPKDSKREAFPTT